MSVPSLIDLTPLQGASHTYNAAKAADVAAVLPSFADEAQALLARLQARGDADA